MQRRDGVRATREFQPNNSHAKFFVWVVRILPPQFHQTFVRYTQCVAQGSEMFLYQIGMKTIVPCRHRRMRRKHYFAGNAADRFIEADSLFFHTGADRFEDSERTMTFIQMENTGSDTHRFE